MDEEKEEIETTIDTDDTQTITIQINVTDPVVEKEIKSWHESDKTSLAIFFGVPIIGFLILAFLIFL